MEKQLSEAEVRENKLKAELYDLVLRTASDTLQSFGKDGGEVGCARMLVTTLHVLSAGKHLAAPPWVLSRPMADLRGRFVMRSW